LLHNFVDMADDFADLIQPVFHFLVRSTGTLFNFDRDGHLRD
jgi:hypothetical protein